LAEVQGKVAWLLPSWPADAVLLPDTPASPIEAAQAFAAQGADVALKMGEDGVLILQAGQLSHVPAIKVAKVIDSTGAGDAWNAAFLVDLIRGQPAIEAAKAANAYAATVLGHRGAIPPR
jgi:2-dehydro-3-deoxygluconokinase